MAATIIYKMQSNNYQILQMKAHEAFIRRASKIELPFMLKGSYVTRQYFPDPNDRIPADLDWVYLDPITDEKSASEKFNEWATRVTELQMDDNVKFVSFKENEFWRRIDYAMADDFPTVNTDLQCIVDGEQVDFDLDVSFNLDVEEPPVSLMYKSMPGDPFLIRYTAPIALQVSWKIHQTLVRPRFKDLFDLLHLVQHPSFDKDKLDKAMQALINECYADNVDLVKLSYFLNFEIEKLFPVNSIEEAWNVWRHNVNIIRYNPLVEFERGHFSTNVSKLPGSLIDFLEQFKERLQRAGLGTHLLENLPEPKRTKRRSFARTLPPTVNIPINNPNSSIPVANESRNWLISKFFRNFFR